MPETQTTSQIQIQSPPPTASPPHEEGPGEVKPHHHITPWVALVIIAAIAATVGYLVWAKAHEAWSFDFDGPWSEVKRNPSTLNGDNQSQVEGWKTYRNDDLGFEFKYPANLFLSDHLASELGEIWQFLTITDAVEGGKDIIVLKLIEKGELEETKKTLKDYIDSIEIRYVAGVNATILEFKSETGVLATFVPYKNRHIHIVFSKSKFPQYIDMFNELLSSFRFTK